MNTYLFSFVFMSLATICSLQATALPFVGKIIVPGRVTEDVCIFYKGTRLPVHRQEIQGSTIFTYEVLEDKKVQNLSFLVCPYIDFKTQANTVQYLKLDQFTPYTFLELTGTRSYGQGNGVAQYSWQAHEKQVSQDDDYKLPDEVLIFLCDPEFVQFQIKSWSQDANTRVLPDCVIKSSVAHSDIERELIKAHFAAVDITTVHAKINNGKKKQFGRVIATMMTS